MNYQTLQEFYNGKNIFVTGHTGFKGSWLCLMLHKLGANIYAYSLEAEDVRGNFYNQINLAKYCATSTIGDIRDYENFEKAYKASNAELVFHLAAQPFVLRSYRDPLETIETNIMGTTNLFEIIRKHPNLTKAIINITSDKCYENKETPRPYEEGDSLGGHDPYSASKGMCEILTGSYRKSFFTELNISLASVRAGNVIGGGDFGENRIIPDLIESIQDGYEMPMRRPNAIRPWQHVFDVLYGYLIAGVKSYNDLKYSDSYNFAPLDNSSITVRELLDNIIKFLEQGEYVIKSEHATSHEAHYLRLDSGKAHGKLGWKNQLDFDDTSKYTADWYSEFLKGSDVQEISSKQLDDFFGLIS